MIIHVVKEGESIHSISKRYQTSEARLLTENGLSKEDALVVGQTIVVVNTKDMYTVKEGDTMASICKELDIELHQLVRNNPDLIERDYVHIGETLVVSYEDDKKFKVTTNGYAFPFITREALIKTLPYLTYLSIYEYVVRPDGTLIDQDDEALIDLAKSYGVAPMMIISSLIEPEDSSESIDIQIMKYQQVREKFIEEIIRVVETKGYYGVNIFAQYFESKYHSNVVEFLEQIRERLNEKGYYLMVTITPKMMIDKNYTDVDFGLVTGATDGVIMLAYEWGYSFSPPEANTPLSVISDYIEHASKQITQGDHIIGLPVVAYHWELPYIEGESIGNAISIDTALTLAREKNAVIQFDEESQSPYFIYDNYEVWFKDARSIGVFSEIVAKYEFHGMAIWNVMNYFAQLWLIINSQFEILRLKNIEKFQIEDRYK